MVELSKKSFKPQMVRSESQNVNEKEKPVAKLVPEE